MSLLSLSEASDDTSFQRRAFMALMSPAVNIINEDPQTPEHAERLEWAQKALTDTLSISPRQLALQILRNPTIAAQQSMADVPDGDIEFQVVSVLADLIRIG